MVDYSDLDTVQKLLEKAQDAEQDLREEAKEAHLFLTTKDGQWEQDWYEACDGKPRYTFDQTSPIIDQIAGDIAESDFDIKIAPAGGDATIELAQFRDGMIRNIETISDASKTYAMAGRNVAAGGIDHWMVKTDYVDEDSFEQDLLIDPIFNSAERVWFDTNAQRQDRADAKYGFLLSAITKDAYDERWPKGSGVGVSNGSETTTYGDKPEQVIIGHFYYIKQKMRELVMTNFGRVFENDKEFKSVEKELNMAGEFVEHRRKRNDDTVYVRKFDGDAWLDDEEETVFDSIPLVPVYGNYSVVDNKPIYFGAVKKLIDPQRVLNYSMSREIEEGALAPRAKIWMTKKQAAGNQSSLATLNTNADPVQFYNVDAEAPPPTQTGGAQINPGLRTISQGMQDMMGRSAGVFAASMGENPGLQSGVAIERLQNKMGAVTSQYMSALEVAICRTAKILNKAMPKVYSAERQVRIMSEDGSFDMQVIGQQVLDEETGEPVMLNDLSRGKYDITCKAAPSFDSRQGETVSAIIDLAAVDPSVLEVGSDIVLKNMNAPGLDKIAERRRAQLFNAGMIPEAQLTDEEREQLAASKEAGEQQPDAMMVAAQAEMAKAEAEGMKVQVSMQKNEIEAMKMQNQIGLDIEKLNLAREKLGLDAQKQELEFAEKVAKLDRETQAQEFNQLVAMRDQQRQMMNDAVDNLNTQADTLNKIREGMGVDAVMGPGGVGAYARQTGEIIEAQDAT